MCTTRQSETFKTRKGKYPLEFYSFEEDQRLCPVACIDAYKEATETIRETHGRTTFFLALKKPFKPVGKSSLARWAVNMLDRAGIDVSQFKAHSIRSASSSKAAGLGIPIQDILKMGNWSGSSVWQKHYHKRVTSCAQKFQNTILGALKKGEADVRLTAE